MARLVLTVPEAAQLLRCHRSSVYKMVAAGHLPVVRVGRAIRIPRAAIQRLLSQ